MQANIFDLLIEAINEQRKLQANPDMAKIIRRTERRFKQQQKLRTYQVKRSGNKALELLRLIHAKPLEMTFKQACDSVGINHRYTYLIDTGAIEVVRDLKVHRISKDGRRTRGGYPVRLGRIGLEKLMAFADNAALPPLV